jgi:GNAT superfamily N-acetyltransferase
LYRQTNEPVQVPVRLCYWLSKALSIHYPILEYYGSITHLRLKAAMDFDITKTSLSEIADLRKQFLHANRIQFICNKCHDYGWADTYLFSLNGNKIGYGSVWGTDHRQDRDTIFEYYLIAPYEKHASSIFSAFITTTNTTYIESQTNDPLLTAMLYEYADNIKAETILFADHHKTDLSFPGIAFRPRKFDDDTNDNSDFFLEAEGQIVASGGLMLNYNFPYADIYMQVKEPFRQLGYGSFIVQELKSVAYAAGRVPAARCNINNHMSKATLQKAGFSVCGFRLKADMRSNRAKDRHPATS